MPNRRRPATDHVYAKPHRFRITLVFEDHSRFRGVADALTYDEAVEKVHEQHRNLKLVSSELRSHEAI